MLLNLIFNCSLGLAFSVCAKERVRADGVFALPAFAVMLMFCGFLLLPTTLYLYTSHPAWACMYLVDPSELSWFFVLLALAAHIGALFAGWFLGARMLRTGSSRFALYAAGGVGVVALLGIATAWERLGVVGTFVEFDDKRALPLMEVKLGYVIVAIVLGVAIGSTIVALELLRDSRRAKTR